MAGKKYAKGYYFERRVKKHYEDLGFFVVRQGKSAFPDLIVVKDALFVECKNWKTIPKDPLKQLSGDEISGFKDIKKKLPHTKCFLAYNKDHKITIEEVI